MLAEWTPRSLLIASVVALAVFSVIQGCSRPSAPQSAGAPAPAKPAPPEAAGSGAPPPDYSTPSKTAGISNVAPPSPAAVTEVAPAAPAAPKPIPKLAPTLTPTPKLTPEPKHEQERIQVAALPSFPWPPPRASAEYRINNRWVTAGDQTTLSQVADRIEAALSAAQYETWRYLAVPSGFALVTPIERIDLNGNLKDPRFGTQLPSLADMTFVEFLFALGKAPAGHYRVFVFVITDVPFNQAEERISRKEAQGWMRSGLTQLPPDVGSMKYGPRYGTTALVYEFSKVAKRPATLVAPSKASASAHLQRARLWDALSH